MSDFFGRKNYKIVRKSFLLSSFFCALLIFGCGPGAGPDRSIGSVAPASGDTAMIDSASNKDTAIMDTAIKHPHIAIKADTISTGKEETTLQREAVLGYSYFKNMREDETRNIDAYILIKNAQNAAISSARVISALKDANKDLMPVRKNDTAVLDTTNIFLYRFVDIIIIDPGGNFTIVPVHDNSRQRVDSLSGNTWEWAVTPKTSAKEGRLIMKVVAEDADGSRTPLHSYNIAIKVSLNTEISRGLWDWLRKNPEKLLVLILIPLITFFGKKIFDRNKAEKADKKAGI